MKLAVMSDLHNESDRRGRRCDLPNPPPGHPRYGPSLVGLEGRIDLALLAGDIDVGPDAVRYGAQTARYLGCPAILIAGNHEFYDSAHDDCLASLRKEAARHQNVYFLENDVAEFELDGARVRVLGATLWTDYALIAGSSAPQAERAATIARAMELAENSLTDHWVIRADGGDALFAPQAALHCHQRSRQWLSDRLATPFDGITIVMTHHGVAPQSLPKSAQLKLAQLARQKGATHPSAQGGSAAATEAGEALQQLDLWPAFVSDLSDVIMASKAPLWVHGHTHLDVDYRIGDTRVLARQRGYPDEQTGRAADAVFEPAVIDL